MKKLFVFLAALFWLMSSSPVVLADPGVQAQTIRSIYIVCGTSSTKILDSDEYTRASFVLKSDPANTVTVYLDGTFATTSSFSLAPGEIISEETPYVFQGQLSCITASSTAVIRGLVTYK